MASQPFAGVLVPVLTPFTPAGEPDAGRFVAFCRWLLDQGADGLAIFGTTSEANSMSAAERMALLDRLIAAGIPAAKLMPGAGACSITEAATLIRHAVGAWRRRRLDAAALLLQGHDRAGRLRFLRRRSSTGSARRRCKMYLYHIPPQTMIAVRGRPGRPADQGLSRIPSSASRTARATGTTPRRCSTLCRPGFGVFPGSEVFLLDGLRNGGGRLHHRRRQRQRARHPQGL